MVNTAMIQCFVDIFMNVAETNTDVFSPEISALTRTIFNLCTVILAAFAYAYVKAYSSDDSKNDVYQKITDIIVWFFLISFVLLGIANIFNGWLSYIDENGAFQNGPLYLMNYLIPLILLGCVLFTAVRRKNTYTRSQFIAIIFFLVLVLLGVVVEFFLQYSTLTVMFGVALAILTVQLSLETPDYKKLIASMAQLQQTNIEVQKAKDAAIEANHAKSDFLARMSHEIRTPMNAVVGMNELIMKSTNDVTIKEFAFDSYQAANNLLNIINDILDFSKIESGKMTLIEDDYKLANVLKDEYTIFSFKAEQKNLTLIFNIDESLPGVLFGDSVRIKQVLTNLLNNACKYTDKGSVVLNVSCVEKSDGYITIRYEIKDTGRGIKKEDIGRLYDMFERLDERNNRGIEGTGLGINIVKHLLTMMDTKLEVESEYGVGSSFSFNLRQKIVDEKPMGDFHDVQDDKNSESQKKKDKILAPEAKVLVVDDNIVNLKVFTGLLKVTKIQVVQANSGEEALKCTMNEKYDIIFMDHMMPLMDGVEAFGKIRAQENGMNRDTKVIVLTANAIKGVEEEYRKIGFDDVLFKPTSQQSLIDAMYKFLPPEKIADE